MARYRLTSPHFAGGRLLPAGEEVEWNEPPTPDMIPLDREAERRIAGMPWAAHGWRLLMTPEALPGGRHPDGSPVLLNRPINFGAPLTLHPPQPDFHKEIPFGCRTYVVSPRHPLASYWGKHRGSIGPNDPLIPYSPEDNQ